LTDHLGTTTTAICRGYPHGVSSSTVKSSSKGTIMLLLVGLARRRDC
jgi:hypothetical protein